MIDCTIDWNKFSGITIAVDLPAQLRSLKELVDNSDVDYFNIQHIVLSVVAEAAV